MRKTGVRRRRAVIATLLVPAAALLVTACGSSEERENELRPPSPVNVAVLIGDDAVDASPAKLGAGPIVVQASNQSSASHRITLEGPQTKQSVGPINPQDTATLKVNVTPGEYSLSADGSSGVKPAKLTVGPKRPSAQNQLLQP